MERILESHFANHYGGLALCRAADGRLYLEMEDCSGEDIFGPLTAEQEAAFRILAQMEPVSTEEHIALTRAK